MLVVLPGRLARRLLRCACSWDLNDGIEDINVRMYPGEAAEKRSQFTTVHPTYVPQQSRTARRCARRLSAPHMTVMRGHGLLTAVRNRCSTVQDHSVEALQPCEVRKGCGPPHALLAELALVPVATRPRRAAASRSRPVPGGRRQCCCFWLL